MKEIVERLELHFHQDRFDGICFSASERTELLALCYATMRAAKVWREAAAGHGWPGELEEAMGKLCDVVGEPTKRRS
jgi:hypothetical protein